MIQVSLYNQFVKEFSREMEKETAGVVAAQVINYLKGDNIITVMNDAAEPLKFSIAEIKDHVPQAAANVMAASKNTREVIVATLRMRAAIEFMLEGKSYFQTERHERVERLLATYGPEFPEKITPGKYLKVAYRIHKEVYGNDEN